VLGEIVLPLHGQGAFQIHHIDIIKLFRFSTFDLLGATHVQQVQADLHSCDTLVPNAVSEVSSVTAAKHQLFTLTSWLKPLLAPRESRKGILVAYKRARK
jgi:hypothetical protein